MTLYTPQILALATELANFPLADGLTHRATTRSRTCGSVITLGFEQDAAGRVSAVGMQVSACAIGQASAAIMARSLMGSRADTGLAAGQALTEWLAGNGELPDWPQIGLLAPALPHKGRHGALLLPWTAAAEALSSVEPRR
ncbi:MAG: iron-sulfur cluster assembly scaffold protein [Erythrobacter sp.]